jgi:methylase of polypeptide subunit release factors
MTSILAAEAQLAPVEWRESTSLADSRLHQLAPYIGKLKPIIARQLLREFTAHNEIVLDCFSGSGTVPLEAVILGRRVLAFDTNPYAVTITRAKLESPQNLVLANEQLLLRLAASEKRPRYAEESIPDWVRKFFHPETLQQTLRFADECLEHDDPFLLACLLSILHHQRPGFLSYPSSHLVPYLRDRKFPRDEYPEMYTERALKPRLEAKLLRAYKDSFLIEPDRVMKVDQVGVADLRLECEVDAIVTSPPYMNALDYVRDNRLRMWFIDRSTADYSPEPTEKQADSDAITAAFARNALKYLRSGGHCVLVIGEKVSRKRVTTHPAERMFAKLSTEYPALQLKHVIEDEIPDVRRSRRSGAATKRELILVLQKA